MKTLIFSIILTALFLSCGTSQTKEEKPKLIELPKKSQSLIIGDPLDCGLEGMLMFPIGTSYDPEIFAPPPKEGASAVSWDLYAEKVNITSNATYAWADQSNDLTFSVNSGLSYDKLAVIEYINEKTNDFDITNILFYELATGKSYPLISNDTLHIISFAIHKEFQNDLIFYRAIREDYNQDEKFNSLDPILLFISPLGGDTLIQVTQEHQQFIDYTYYEESQKIVAKTRIDSDLDTFYTPADETNFVEMRLDSPAFGRPLFPDNLKDLLKGQINL
jgi:hypothetical protein